MARPSAFPSSGSAPRWPALPGLVFSLSHRVCVLACQPTQPHSCCRVPRPLLPPPPSRTQPPHAQIHRLPAHLPLPLCHLQPAPRLHHTPYHAVPPTKRSETNSSRPSSSLGARSPARRPLVCIDPERPLVPPAAPPHPRLSESDPLRSRGCSLPGPHPAQFSCVRTGAAEPCWPVPSCRAPPACHFPRRAPQDPNPTSRLCYYLQSTPEMKVKPARMAVGKRKGQSSEAGRRQHEVLWWVEMAGGRRAERDSQDLLHLAPGHQRGCITSAPLQRRCQCRRAATLAGMGWESAAAPAGGPTG